MFRVRLRGLQVRFKTTWANVPEAPADKILGLNTKFQLDNNPLKINLGVGAYRDDNGKPWILPSVRMAEKILYDTEKEKEYAPILGAPQYIEQVQRLLWGSDRYGLQLLSDGRVVTAQGVSGTGSLRVLAEFLKRFHYNQKVLVPYPTWGNHLTIMQRAGLYSDSYRYFDYKNNVLDFDGMCEDLNNCDPGTGVLLHMCCHNPTGVDATPEQWDQIVEIVVRRQLLPVLDLAYLGFGSGDPIKDLGTLNKFNEAIAKGLLPTYLMAQSFAKNMGLYGERVGSLSVVTSDAEESTRVSSQLAKVIRSMYSSPPVHGAKIVKIILGTPELYQQWLKDVKTMATRLTEMRQLLFDLLTKELANPLNWDHLLSQKGMFCFTGLSPEQVQLLRKKGIYMTDDGRISIAGITTDNVRYLAICIDEVTE